MNLRSCILVSDGYHIFRAKRMLQGQGITVYGSPRPTETTNPRELTWLYFRQAVGYAMWRIGINI
jgi:uncharacterized SAM-binding protein YcdF (DUF218 family)